MNLYETRYGDEVQHPDKVFEDYKIIKSLSHFNVFCRNVISGHSSLNQSIPRQGFSSRMVDHNPVVMHHLKKAPVHSTV